MAEDLHISPAQNSLLGSLFFLGYFLFQIPGAIYAQKYSAKRLIFFGLIGWGLLASATGLITNINLLYLDRFLLGMVESAVLARHADPAVALVHQQASAPAPMPSWCWAIRSTMLWMSLLSGYLAGRPGLAHDVHHRRCAAGLLGLCLVAAGGGPPARSGLVRPRRTAGAGRQAGGGAARHRAGAQLCRRLQKPARDRAVAAVFSLEHRGLWLCDLAAVHSEEAGHEHGRRWACWRRCPISRR